METVRLSLPDVSWEARLALVVSLFGGLVGRWVPHRMSDGKDCSQHSTWQTRQRVRPGVGVPLLLEIGGWDIRPSHRFIARFRWLGQGSS